MNAHPAREFDFETARAALRRGELRASELVASCLERIEAREPSLHAWVELHGELALEQAERLDAAFARGETPGVLHGIPIGVKDVIDVAGMTTRAGSSAYAPRVAEQDAVAVARLRAAGAIVLGKTVTTAFAGRDPGPTRNRFDQTRTPGGSSSGSGVAVGDRMCLAALGTQSGGSVLRPAAFNGVVGFKPSRGAAPLDGVVPNVHELDHVGVIAGNAAAVRTLFDVMRNPDTSAPRTTVGRVWRIRGFDETGYDEAWLECVERTCRLLAEAGITIEDDPWPIDLVAAREAHLTIGAALQARYFADVDEELCARLEPGIADRLACGRKLSASTLVEALRCQRAVIAALDRRLAAVDFAILPCAPGLPAAIDDTGDARFLWPFSLGGQPAISVPAGTDDQGFPVAVQLAGRSGTDDRLLCCAQECEGLLDRQDR